MLTKSKHDRYLLIIFVIWALVTVGFHFFSSQCEQKPKNPPRTEVAHPRVAPTPYTDKELAGWYATYNSRYFSGHLPKDTKVRWAFLEGRYGETANPQDNFFVIRLDIPKNREAIMAKQTLLHEMCHVATYGKELDFHGPLWQAEIHRLMMEGAWDDLV